MTSKYTDSSEYGASAAFEVDEQLGLENPMWADGDGPSVSQSPAPVAHTYAYPDGLGTQTRLESAGQSPASHMPHSRRDVGTSNPMTLGKHGALHTESQSPSTGGWHDEAHAAEMDDGESPTDAHSRSGSATQDDARQGLSRTDPAIAHGETSNPEHAPSWTEMKTKAGKERKRLPLACIACRRKKIRCSGEKPACKHCLRSRIPCVYKVTTRKAAPRTDYMAMLDKRLKRMEDRIIKLVPKERVGHVQNVVRAVVKPSSQESRKRTAGQAFRTGIDQWAKAGAAAPGAEARQVKAEPLENLVLREGADRLPPKEIQTHLAEVFFDFVYGQSYLLLHKPSFMRKLRVGAVPPVLLLAVCAVSARFSTHPQVATEPTYLRGEVWASAARDIALKLYDVPDLTILTVYLILGLHEFGTCQGGRSWMLGGMAQRMAYALVLHKDPDYEPSDKLQRLSFTDKEIRRRLMWACFTMDRFNSSGTNRPMFAPEQYIRTHLPVKEQYFQMEIPAPTEDVEGNRPPPMSADMGQTTDLQENMGVAAYMIRAIAIWGRLVQYMNLGGREKDKFPMWSRHSEFHKLKALVDDFIASQPNSLRYNLDNLQTHASERIANQFIFFHIICQQIILFLNRFSVPSIASALPPRDTPAEFIASASHAAHDAAQRISLLIHQAMDHNVVAPFAGYAAFFSSVVHVGAMFSRNPDLEHSARHNLAYNVAFLRKLKNYWGMFHFVAENLRDLYRQYSEAALRGPGALDSDTGTPTVFQYGDWFDRYPHGISGSAREESAADVKREVVSTLETAQSPDLQTVEEFFASLSPFTVEQPSRTGKKPKQARTPPNEYSPFIHPTVSTGIDSGVPNQQALSHPALTRQPLTVPIGIIPAPSQPQIYSQPQYPSQPLTDADAHLSSPMPGMVPQQPLQPGFPGMDPSVTIPAVLADPMSTAADIQPQTGNGWEYDFDRVDGNFFADSSATWFMPFNVNPPELGVQSGFSNAEGMLSGYQWAPSQHFQGLPMEIAQHGVDLDDGAGDMRAAQTARPHGSLTQL